MASLVEFHEIVAESEGEKFEKAHARSETKG